VVPERCKESCRRAVGGLTAGKSFPNLADAQKFTPGIGWTRVTANLPIPTDTRVDPPQAFLDAPPRI
jgi:hypothetical protein